MSNCQSTYEGGSYMNSQHTRIITSDKRKEILEMCVAYNQMSFGLAVGLPVHIIVCAIASIVDICVFNILPKIIGVLILIVAIVRIVSLCRGASELRARMQEAGNHLKSNKDIINDIISNPVIEYNPEDYMMTIKGKHFMSKEILIILDMIFVFVSVVLSIGAYLQPTAWLVISVLLCIAFTIFLIYMTVKRSKERKEDMMIMRDKKSGDLISIPTAKLYALKRCNKWINRGY